MATATARAEYAACAANAQCFAFGACVEACNGSSSCTIGCQTFYPFGQQPHEAWSACVCPHARATATAKDAEQHDAPPFADRFGGFHAASPRPSSPVTSAGSLSRSRPPQSASSPAAVRRTSPRAGRSWHRHRRRRRGQCRRGGRLRKQPGQPQDVPLHAVALRRAQVPAWCWPCMPARRTPQSYRNAGWEELADEFGFWVVYPEQQSANNALGCFNWAGEYGDPTNLQARPGREPVDQRNGRHDDRRSTASTPSACSPWATPAAARRRRC